MNILVADSNATTHGELTRCVSAAFPNDTVTDFLDPLLALKYGYNNLVDMLVTAVRMRGVDGARLAVLLRKKNARLRVIFVSDGPLRRESDFEAKPEEVLQYPVTEKDFDYETEQI